MDIVLRALELSWLGDQPDDGHDQCAHGRVLLSVGDQRLVGAEDGELTLSAAALYLLRTLETDRIPGDGLADENQLFPCCGHSIYEADSGIVIMGCPNGVDMSVITADGIVTVRRDERIATISSSAWRQAVLGFAEQVETFYSHSVPRTPIEDQLEAAGWRLFWQEWHQRTGLDPLHPEQPANAAELRIPGH